MATVLRPNKPPIAVHNLGWLLRNWRSVAHLGFNLPPSGASWPPGGELIARCRDGTVYITDFASLSVCWRWLNRPVFRGLHFTLAQPATGTRSNWVIGSANWRALQRLSDHGSAEKLREFETQLRQSLVKPTRAPKPNNPFNQNIHDKDTVPRRV